MEDPIVFNFIAGVIVSLLTSLAKQGWMSAKVKNLLAIVGSVAAAVAYVLATNPDLTAGEWTTVALTVYGVSQAFYSFILKNAGLETTLAQVGPRNGGTDNEV